MSEEVSSVIGKEIKIVGEITGKEDLLVEGKIEGRIYLESELLIGESGEVRGEIEVKTLTVEGNVEGEMKSIERASFRPGCKVQGKIVTPALVIEEGAVFTGDVEMEIEEIQGE